MPGRKNTNENDPLNAPFPFEEGDDDTPLGEVTDARDRARIKREGTGDRRTGGAVGKGGGRWGKAEVRTISYTPPENVRTSHAMLRAGDLRVDPRYNRDIKPGWVQEIADHFNPDQLQTLNVSRRLYRLVDGIERQVFDGAVGPGTREEYVVISGQHRLLATLQAKGEDFLLSCNVYDTLTEAQEAELFALWDEKIRPHQAWQRHKAHVFGRNPEALAIDKIVTDVGLVVYTGQTVRGGHDDVIRAVSTLYTIYRNMGADALRRILEIHYLAWGENLEGYTNPMLVGTAILLRRFGAYSQWKDEYLIQALSDPAHNPQTLRQRAQGAAAGISATSISQEVARLEHRYYNQGKKGYQRLPEWNATANQIRSASEAADARSSLNRKRPAGATDEREP
jgi:hypothetical protein